MGLYRLLKNPADRVFRRGTALAVPDKFFIIVIPQGLQPLRDLFFAHFKAFFSSLFTRALSKHR